MSNVSGDWRDVIEGREQAAVVCGDCLDVLADMPDASIGGIITDPPYGVSVAGSVHGGSHGSRNLDFSECDRDWNQCIKVMSDAARHCVRIADVRASMYWWCGHRQLGHLAGQLESAGWSTRFLVWEKACPAPAPPWAGWPSGAELCLYAYRAGRKWGIAPRNMPRNNIIVADSYRQGQPGKVDHPTQKPPQTVRLPLEASTFIGDVVLDAFCGSGTTGVVCAQEGRRFIGIEIDPGYAEIARSRISAELAQQKLYAGHVASTNDASQESN